MNIIRWKKTSADRSLEKAHGITDPDGKPYEIPAGGSMSLLALGYRGLMAWRAKRIAEAKQQEINVENEPGK